MTTSNASTPEEYLAELPAERRALLEAVHGMLGYVVPLDRYPDT